MGIIVKDGESEGRVGIAHWWHGRDWWHTGNFTYATNPIPAYMRRRAHRMKSKYMTMVRVSFPEADLATYAICRENDQPCRAKGRFIALLRMGRLLKSMGLKMERK